MKGGGPVFGKVRASCDQEYAYKMELVENILADFDELLRLEREFPYLNINYNRDYFRRGSLSNLSLDKLEYEQNELNSYLTFLSNLNETVINAANHIRSSGFAETIIRRLKERLNETDSNLVIGALIRMGVYNPPPPPTYQPSRTNFVYDAGIDHYADARSRASYSGRTSTPYSYVNQNPRPEPEPERPFNTSYPNYQSRSARTTPRYQSRSTGPMPRYQSRSTGPMPENQSQKKSQSKSCPTKPASKPQKVYFDEKNYEIKQMNLSQIKALKKKYRKLAVELHPDTGDKQEEFKTMQTQWDNIKDSVQKRYMDLTPSGSKRKKSRKVRRVTKVLKKRSKALQKKKRSKKR